MQITEDTGLSSVMSHNFGMAKSLCMKAEEEQVGIELQCTCIGGIVGTLHPVVLLLLLCCSVEAATFMAHVCHSQWVQHHQADGRG